MTGAAKALCKARAFDGLPASSSPVEVLEHRIARGMKRDACGLDGIVLQWEINLSGKECDCSVQNDRRVVQSLPSYYGNISSLA